MNAPSLRRLLGRGRPIWIMGAHDVLSARIIAKAGFDAIGVQSLQMAFVNGLPDIGVVGPEDLVRVCRGIRRAVDLPIVVDFEQGFGEPYAAVHWMKELQAAGVSAIHIDDYGLPYKCPFIPPHVMNLEDREATAAKIRALAGEKNDPEFMVIGRPGTYVASVHKTEEERRADWLSRAHAYLRAGADALFPICWTVDQAAWFRSQVPGPLITIRTLGTKIPVDRVQYSDAIMDLSVQRLYEMGYEMYIEPTTLIGVAANAMWQAAQAARTAGGSSVLAEQHGSLYDHLENWMDVETVRRIRRQYVQEDGAETGS
ncbi:MAG: isocitrate lyase/PEP mutase family protein [Acidobacteriaceae bacterium]